MNALIQQFADTINRLHQEASTAARTAVLKALECGDVLIQAKAAIPHGQWSNWLTANTTISPRTARLYMQLAENRPQLENRSDLSLRDAAQLIAAPAEKVKRQRVADLLALCEERFLQALDESASFHQANADRSWDDYDGLSKAERRARHEAVIEQILAYSIEQASALLQIRDGRLYRYDYRSFDDYCEHRFEIPIKDYADWVLAHFKQIRRSVTHRGAPLKNRNAVGGEQP